MSILKKLKKKNRLNFSTLNQILTGFSMYCSCLASCIDMTLYHGDVIPVTLTDIIKLHDLYNHEVYV